MRKPTGMLLGKLTSTGQDKVNCSSGIASMALGRIH